VPAMRGVHKARDSPAQDQVAVETPLPPSGNSGRSGLRRDGDGDPAATREPPATSAGTALWGDAGLRARRDRGLRRGQGTGTWGPGCGPAPPGDRGDERSSAGGDSAADSGTHAGPSRSQPLLARVTNPPHAHHS
jgi:hypothetical protein